MTTVEMTAEERQEFEAYKLAKEKKAAEAKRKSDREAYTELVDETIAAVMPELTNISEAIAQKKTAAAEAFRGALEMKAELFGVKDDQQSHTFTNSEGTMRITIGHYMLDNYRDTVNVSRWSKRTSNRRLATMPAARWSKPSCGCCRATRRAI